MPDAPKLFLYFLLLILSAAFPPALLVTVPLFLGALVRTVRLALFLRRSREAYYEEAAVLNLGNLFRGGKR